MKAHSGNTIGNWKTTDFFSQGTVNIRLSSEGIPTNSREVVLYQYNSIVMELAEKIIHLEDLLSL